MSLPTQTFERVRSESDTHSTGRARNKKLHYSNGNVSSTGWLYSAGGLDLNYRSRETYDNITEDWSKRQKSGEVIMNDFLSHKEEVVLDGHLGGTVEDGTEARGYGYKAVYTMDDSVLSILQPYAMPDLDSQQIASYSTWLSQATTKLHAKIGEPETLFGASVAEAGKTVTDMVHLYRAVTRYVRKAIRIRRLLLKGLISATKAAEMWLGVRYGLRPIFYDVKSTLEALDALDGQSRVRLTTSTGLDSKSTNTIVTHEDTGHVLYDFHADIKDVTSASLTAGAVLRLHRESPSVIQAFGLDKPLETAWELVPWSFVVDWFINIGDYLASWTPEYSISCEGTWATLNERCVRTFTVTDFGLNVSNYSKMFTHYYTTYPRFQYTVYKADNWSDSATAIVSASRRRRFGNPPLPKLPRFNIRLNWLKLTDLVLLLKQLRSSW